LKLLINGENKDFADGLSLEDLIRQLGVRKETVVAEVNRKIIQNERRADCKLADGDQVELIQFVGGADGGDIGTSEVGRHLSNQRQNFPLPPFWWVRGNTQRTSSWGNALRLRALKSSRWPARVNLDNKGEKTLLDFIDPKKYTLLPNTAGCYSAEEAIRVAHLARATGISDFVKLEVLHDEKTLLPDPSPPWKPPRPS